MAQLTMGSGGSKEDCDGSMRPNSDEQDCDDDG